VSPAPAVYRNAQNILNFLALLLAPQTLALRNSIPILAVFTTCDAARVDGNNACKYDVSCKSLVRARGLPAKSKPDSVVVWIGSAG
jgi:hypothetical protein